MSQLWEVANITELKTRYNLDIFVETGVGTNAEGLNWARTELGFTELYSCDVAPKNIEAARQRVPDAHIYEMKSSDFLKEIGPLIENKRCMFWLDAHVPEDYNVDVRYEEHDRLPLRSELDILAKKPGIEHDVILCDDYESDRLNMKDFVHNYFKDTHDQVMTMDSTKVIAFIPKEKQ